MNDPAKNEVLDALVIGAGFAGICMGKRLKELQGQFTYLASEPNQEISKLSPELTPELTCLVRGFLAHEDQQYLLESGNRCIVLPFCGLKRCKSWDVAWLGKRESILPPGSVDLKIL